MAAQDYPDLTVLVVDCGSDDDPTARVAAHLPGAFVRRLGERGRALPTPPTRHSRLVEGATFLLLCHDDVVPRPRRRSACWSRRRTGRTPASSARSSSAPTTPTSCSRSGTPSTGSGVPYTGIEPGEFDQEQHDARARRVLRDHRDDARAGRPVHRARRLRPDDLPRRGRPRSLLASAARRRPRPRGARRAGAAPRSGRRSATGGPPGREHARRGAACACCSPRTRCRHLLWLVPVGVVVSFVEALGDLVTGRPRAGTSFRRRLVLEPVPPAQAPWTAQACPAAPQGTRSRSRASSRSGARRG